MVIWEWLPGHRKTLPTEFCLSQYDSLTFGGNIKAVKSFALDPKKLTLDLNYQFPGLRWAVYSWPLYQDSLTSKSVNLFLLRFRTHNRMNQSGGQILLLLMSLEVSEEIRLEAASTYKEKRNGG